MCLKSTLESRLAQAQKEVIYTNYALLLLLAGRNEAARECTATLMKWCAIVTFPLWLNLYVQHI